jgi:hypothetical protein
MLHAWLQVILDICNNHADEIAACVADMVAMQQNVEQLRDLILQGNEALQVPCKTVPHACMLASHVRYVVDPCLGVKHFCGGYPVSTWLPALPLRLTDRPQV